MLEELDSSLISFYKKKASNETFKNNLYLGYYNHYRGYYVKTIKQ